MSVQCMLLYGSPVPMSNLLLVCVLMTAKMFNLKQAITQISSCLMSSTLNSSSVSEIGWEFGIGEYI